MTLQEIIVQQQACRVEGGMFGVAECKEAIRFYLGCGKDLKQQLEEYVRQANEDPFFNKRMVLACWEMVNGQKGGAA